MSAFTVTADDVSIAVGAVRVVPGYPRSVFLTGLDSGNSAGTGGLGELHPIPRAGTTRPPFRIARATTQPRSSGQLLENESTATSSSARSPTAERSASLSAESRAADRGAAGREGAAELPHSGRSVRSSWARQEVRNPRRAKSRCSNPPSGRLGPSGGRREDSATGTVVAGRSAAGTHVHGGPVRVGDSGHSGRRDTRRPGAHPRAGRHGDQHRPAVPGDPGGTPTGDRGVPRQPRRGGVDPPGRRSRHAQDQHVPGRHRPPGASSGAHGRTASPAPASGSASSRTGSQTLAARQASGDLPAQVIVLPGQEGSGDEGTAMLEIVHDLAPGADLYFATGLDGQARFAANIEALCDAGANVIVDDIGYYLEANLQDGIIAQGVNAAVADGCYFFSAAGNDGNLNDKTSGVWEGDYAAGSSLTVEGETAGVRHDFGSGKEEDPVVGVVLRHGRPAVGRSTGGVRERLRPVRGRRRRQRACEFYEHARRLAGSDRGPFRRGSSSYSRCAPRRRESLRRGSLPAPPGI